MSITKKIKDKINGNGRDVKESIIGAAIDAIIVFLLMLPTASMPTTTDLYLAVRVSLMVFLYSLARNLKLRTHFKELISIKCTQPTINFNAFSNECKCKKKEGSNNECT